MITSSLLSTPEVVWGAITTAVGGVGAGAYRLLHLEGRVSTLEEAKSDTKDDLKYLRDRMDKLVEHLLEDD